MFVQFQHARRNVIGVRAAVDRAQRLDRNRVRQFSVGHLLRERVAFPRPRGEIDRPGLPRRKGRAKIAIESPRPVESCADADHISTRMLKLDERLADPYEQATAPVVQEQLAKAGLRLAALLNSIWP